MRTLIDKINYFESLPVQTVGEFNQIFPYTRLEHLPAELEVEVGELADGETTRWLLVGGLIIKHSFEAVKVDKLPIDLEEEKDDEF